MTFVQLNQSSPKSEPILHFFHEAQTSHQSLIRYIHIPPSLSLSLSLQSPIRFCLMYVCIYTTVAHLFFFWGFKREQIFKTKNVQNTIFSDLFFLLFHENGTFRFQPISLYFFGINIKNLYIILYHIKLLFGYDIIFYI